MDISLGLFPPHSLFDARGRTLGLRGMGIVVDVSEVTVDPAEDVVVMVVVEVFPNHALLGIPGELSH